MVGRNACRNVSTGNICHTKPDTQTKEVYVVNSYHKKGNSNVNESVTMVIHYKTLTKDKGTISSYMLLRLDHLCSPHNSDF